MSVMSERLHIRPEVRRDLSRVVALETAVLTHGLPWPENLEAAREMEAAVRDAGAVPATIGLLDGKIVVGLDDAELERLARSKDALKVGAKDLIVTAARGRDGGTTVGGTVRAASRAGVRWMATGGIGGVHRGAEETFDVSADLAELARCPVVVVCAGAKSLLDLPRTMEALETLGVPVLGFRTSELPGFYTASTGIELEMHADDETEVASLAGEHAEWLERGILIVQKPPAHVALDRELVESWIEEGLEAAASAGIHGKQTTPFLLSHVARVSGGRTLATNLALLRANASLAGRLALAQPRDRIGFGA